MRRAGALAGLCLLSGALCSSWAPAQAEPDDQEAKPERAAGPAIVDPVILEQAWQAAKTKFCDPRYHGVDWDAVLAKYKPLAASAVTERELHDLVIQMLGELKASHTTLLEKEYASRFLDAGPRVAPVPMLGMTITRLEGKTPGYFVSRILPGSSADAAGVRRGDRLIAIDGRPPNPERLLPTPYEAGLGGPRSYLVPCEKNTSVDLRFERTPTPLGRYEVTLEAHGWNETSAGWVARRVIERDGLRFGYVRIYHLLGYDAVSMTDEFLRKHPTLDGVIVDLRGRGGMPEAAEQLLSLFDRSRVATSKRHPSGAFFSKPCVALIDAGTRSVKEMIAFEWRRRKIGLLVGRRTRGAFLGVDIAGGVRPLADGSVVMIPSVDMRAVAGGVDIEGEGVPPDVEVEDPLPYANGKDPILAAGVETLMRSVRTSQRRKGAWY